jgi:hypothetical protein
VVESTQKSVTKSENCGCYVRGGKLDIQCLYHKRRDKLLQERFALYLQARIRKVFSKTHLRELEAEVFEEVRKLRKNYTYIDPPI